MGETQSKPMMLGNLSESDVEKIRKKFQLKDNNGKISTLDFIYGYPCILRPYVALILPSLHEMFKKKRKNLEKNSSFGINYAFSMIFKRGSKKFKNEISLQEMVTILSYLVTGKIEIIVNILCRSFLTYRKLAHTREKKNELKSTETQDKQEKEKCGLSEKKETIEKDVNNMSHAHVGALENGKQNDNENHTQYMEHNKDDGDIEEEEDSRKLAEYDGEHPVKMKTVLSDSNINEMNKRSKKERSYKFIQNNIYMLDKQAVNCTVWKNCNIKDLIEIEESLHHLFTYMYIEQLYLLCPSNTLFHLSKEKAASSEKNKMLDRSKTHLCKEFLLKRKNSWDMTFFFPDLYYSLETDLDFRNILSGFRLYINSKENSKLSLYCLAVDFISSTFLNMGMNYSEATLKHFTDMEHVAFANEKKEEDKEFINGDDNKNNVLEIKKDAELDDLCLNSFELIHSIYTNMKKNELKNQESADKAPYKKECEQNYTRSSSILEIQNKTNGWRGIFLNKTSKILTDEIVFALRQCSQAFTNNEWYRLYASWKQGTSFNRFISSFLHYPSPIVIVIKTNDGQILGGVSTTPLKDSYLYNGSSSDFLFSANPIFRIIRTNGLGNNYVYLNSKNSFYPKGVGFGGKTECFRLFLSDEFKESYCTQSDYTYEGGRLYFPLLKKKASKLNASISNSGSNTVFKRSDNNSITKTDSTIKEEEMEYRQKDKPMKNTQKKSNSNRRSSSISSKSSVNSIKYKNKEESDEEEEVDSFLCKLHVNEVEVWGCGDTSALEEQRIMLQNEETCKTERRSVDKSKIVQNSFDKEFLLPKMFVGKMEEIAPNT